MARPRINRWNHFQGEVAWPRLFCLVKRLEPGLTTRREVVSLWDMTVTLPENIPALQNMTEADVKRELALSLYAARRITLIQGVDLSSMGFFDFQAALRDRQIPQHYDESDFEKDLVTLRELEKK